MKPWSCFGLGSGVPSAEAAALAEEVEHELQSERAADYFAHMYGNTPSGWSPELTGYERLRLITNVFTRTRVLTLDNELDYDYKGGYADIPENRRAWFDADDHVRRSLKGKQGLADRTVSESKNGLRYCEPTFGCAEIQAALPLQPIGFLNSLWGLMNCLDQRPQLILGA